MVGERRSCHKGALIDPADSPVIVVVTRDGTKDAANSSRVPVEVEVASKRTGAGWVRLEAWVGGLKLCSCETAPAGSAIVVELTLHLGKAVAACPQVPRIGDATCWLAALDLSRCMQQL